MGASSMMYGRPMEAGMSPMSDGTRRREMELHPLVSIIIPCRNESAHIATCLDSILANDYPTERIEIIVVDGMSDDGTRDVLAAYAERYAQIRVMDNPRRITPAALNIGICAAGGDVIMRM